MAEQIITIRLELHTGDATHYVFWPKPNVVICDVVRLNHVYGVWTVEGESEEMVFTGYAEEKTIALAQYLRMRLASLSPSELEEKKKVPGA